MTTKKIIRFCKNLVWSNDGCVYLILVLLIYGFKFFTELIEVCATNTLFTAETGMFTSMDSNNDGLYDNNLDCVWTIETSESQIVKLHVQSIDIQTDEICRYDSLEVRKC